MACFARLSSAAGTHGGTSQGAARMTADNPRTLVCCDARRSAPAASSSPLEDPVILPPATAGIAAAPPPAALAPITPAGTAAAAAAAAVARLLAIFRRFVRLAARRSASVAKLWHRARVCAGVR